MSSPLPWTKFQDFYLRLGFLKALVQVLGDERRSVRVESIVRRLEAPLFNDARQTQQLWSRAQSHMSEYPDANTELGRDKKSKKTYPTVAECLLVTGNHPSYLFAITKPTTYKIVDWGRDLQLIGRGNQITERGLLLRALSNEGAADRFLSGDVSAWDPFALSRIEQVLLLYHLTELDGVSLYVADHLGTLKTGEPLELVEAGRIVFHALESMLVSAEKSVRPADIPAYRTALELAGTIADELGVETKLMDSHGRKPVPRPQKPAAIRKALLQAVSGSTPRKTHKNADHQTVPRFEQLVDLGFLTKDGGEDNAIERRRWKWRPTDLARRWADARAATHMQPKFHWRGFARSAVAAYTASGGTYAGEDTLTIARYLVQGYRSARRPVGHTPLDSAALLAMAAAASDGIAIELQDFHRLMLTVKKQGLLQGEVFFASGNDLDKMFIMIRDDFADRVSQVLPPVLQADQI